VAIDYTTPVGVLRLRIADTDEDAPTLTDPQVKALLALRGVTGSAADGEFQEEQRGPLLHAAADALLTIAASETLIGKYIRQADGTTTDGTKVGAELRAQATLMRAEADLADAEAGDDPDMPDVVEFRPGGYR
jgi:hypothetical protein